MSRNGACVPDFGNDLRDTVARLIDHWIFKSGEVSRLNVLQPTGCKIGVGQALPRYLDVHRDVRRAYLHLWAGQDLQFQGWYRSGSSTLRLNHVPGGRSFSGSETTRDAFRATRSQALTKMLQVAHGIRAAAADRR